MMPREALTNELWKRCRATLLPGMRRERSGNLSPSSRMTYERDVHLIQSGADDKLMENASPVAGKQKPDSDQRRQR